MNPFEWPDTPNAQALRNALVVEPPRKGNRRGLLPLIVKAIRREWEHTLQRHGQDPKLHMTSPPTAEVRQIVEQHIRWQFCTSAFDDGVARKLSPLLPITGSECIERVLSTYFDNGCCQEEEAASLVEAVCRPVPYSEARLYFPIDDFNWNPVTDGLDDSALSINARQWTWRDPSSGASLALQSEDQSLMLAGYATQKAMLAWSTHINQVVELGSNLLDAASFDGDYNTDGLETPIILAAVWNDLTYREMFSLLLSLHCTQANAVTGIDVELATAISLMVASHQHGDARIRLLMYCCAIEALLCMRGTQTRDFSLRAAVVLCACASDRMACSKALARLYDHRSHVAHGNVESRSVDYERWAACARVVATAALSSAMWWRNWNVKDKHQTPSKEEWIGAIEIAYWSKQRIAAIPEDNARYVPHILELAAKK